MGHIFAIISWFIIHRFVINKYIIPEGLLLGFVCRYMERYNKINIQSRARQLCSNTHPSSCTSIVDGLYASTGCPRGRRAVRVMMAYPRLQLACCIVDGLPASSTGCTGHRQAESIIDGWYASSTGNTHHRRAVRVVDGLPALSTGCTHR